MRRFTFLLLAGLVMLSAACSRQPTEAETAETSTVPFWTQDTQTAPPEPTQTADETPLTANESAPAATQPPASTTQPPVSTTQPPVSTTQPPASTTQPPASTTLPPETDLVSFSSKRVRYYTGYKEDFSPTAAVADSRESLDDMLHAVQNGTSQNGLQTNDFAGYTDEWFQTHRLIVANVQENSGSVGHSVRRVAYTKNGAVVTIERSTPQVQTCDIAQWLILIELPDTQLNSGDAVELIWKDREISKASVVLQ